MAGRQGFFSRVSRNPNKDGPFSCKPCSTLNLAFSSSCVGFRSVSSCASPMTLAMTLAAKDFRGFLRGNFRSALEKCPRNSSALARIRPEARSRRTRVPGTVAVTSLVPSSCHATELVASSSSLARRSGARLDSASGMGSERVALNPPLPVGIRNRTKTDERIVSLCQVEAGIRAHSR